MQIDGLDDLDFSIRIEIEIKGKFSIVDEDDYHLFPVSARVSRALSRVDCLPNPTDPKDDTEVSKWYKEHKLTFGPLSPITEIHIEIPHEIPQPDNNFV